MSTSAPYLARPLRRLSAAAIDCACVLLFALLTVGVVHDAGLSTPAMLLGAVVAYGGYHMGFQYWWVGETPGYRFMGVRLVNIASRRKPNLAQCVGRPLLQVIWLASFIPV